MSPRRLRALFAATGAATLAATTAFALAGGPHPATGADLSPGGRAEALAATAPDTFSLGASYAGGAQAAERAAQRAPAVPLPPGQTFDDIDWRNGPLGDMQIQALLEFNAACRWWIVDAGAPTADSARVVEAIPQWPTMRGGQRHAMAESFAAGGDAKLAAQTLKFCRSQSKH